jgi:hypothetical protein
MQCRINIGRKLGESIMSKFISSALLAVALLSGASQAMARPASFTDMADRYGGHAPNSQQGQRAFWDYQARQGD